MENTLRAPRIPLTSDAAVHLGGELILCRTWDISSSGMSLVCPYRRRMSRALTVEFFLSKESGWLRVEANLVRSEPFSGGYIWGIQFKELDDQAATSIESHILSQLVQEAVQLPGIEPLAVMA